MSATQTKATVQHFFQLLAQRKQDELIDLFSEQVDWYIPGDEGKVPWLGRRSTKKEIKEFYDLLWKNTEPVSVEIENLFVEENCAVITGEFSTKMLQTNKIVHSPFCIQITVVNELITRYHLLEDSYAVSISLTA